METTLAPETRRYYLERMRATLEALPRTLEPGVAHLSELELCPMKVHYTRTLKELPPLTDESVLQFMRGRGLEFFVSKELPVISRDGICGTIDDRHIRICELKSTASDMGRFDPKKNDWWIQRIKGYLALVHELDADLVVWFILGDTFSEKNPKKRTKTDIRAWTLSFTEDEIAENWDYLIEQRAMMFWHIDHNEMPPDWWVAERKKSFECGGCRFAGIGCPYFDAGGM